MHLRRFLLFVLIASLVWTIVTLADDRSPIVQDAAREPVITNQIVGYAPTRDRNDPSDRMVPVFMINPDRV